MRLLFDQHLSYRLAARLVDIFPGSSHCNSHFLARADDAAIWDFARVHGYAIVSKDTDFRDLSLLRGSPPKVIWLRVGNCDTAQVEDLLRRNLQRVLDFENDADASILTLE